MEEITYIFLYSDSAQAFETDLVKASIHFGSLQLRARYNPQRNLKMYGLLVTPEYAAKVNKYISNHDHVMAWHLVQDKVLQVVI